MGLWFSLAAIISMFGLWRVRRVATTVSVPVCARCHYSLTGLPSDAICPECASPIRLRHRVRHRSYILPVFGRLPLIWLVFLVVPPLWAYANLVGTTVRYAKVEGFSAGWRNASVSFGEAVTLSDYLERLTPCAAFIALAAIYWPPRARWTIAGVLVLSLGWLSWHALSPWHRHPGHETPFAFFFIIAVGSNLLRAVYLYTRSAIARRRLGMP